MRSTISETRLIGLVLLHIHYNIMGMCTDEIICQFATLHPRKMELVNILTQNTSEMAL